MQTPTSDPEELLKMLDLQLAAARRKKIKRESDERAAFRFWSLVLLVVGTIIAFAFLQFSLSQMLANRPPHKASAPSATAY